MKKYYLLFLIPTILFPNIMIGSQDSPSQPDRTRKNSDPIEITKNDTPKIYKLSTTHQEKTNSSIHNFSIVGNNKKNSNSQNNNKNNDDDFDFETLFLTDEDIKKK